MIKQYFLDDWCVLENGDTILKKYPTEFKHTTYKDALRQQAIDIYESSGINTIFISGGIDSQTKALGFILAGIDCNIVFIKTTFEDKSNDRELFYAEEFCKKYNKELNIFEVVYTRDSLEQMLFDKDYFTTSIGSGNIIQYDAIKKYTDMYDEDIIVSIGYFFMNREKDICYGSFLKPNFGYMVGIDTSRVLLFDTYSTNLYKYYEYVHKNTKEIQFLERFAGKNLSYTELGMPLRPKLASWEFLDDENDYFKLSSIDWADDHSAMARLTVGPHVILKRLGYNRKIREEILSKRPQFNPQDCYLKLYEFKTDVNYKV